MVTVSEGLTPSDLKTFATVKNKIFKSDLKLMLAVYQISSANFSSQEMALRPLICAHPVIPGRTSCLFFENRYIVPNIAQEVDARPNDAHIAR